MMRKENPVQPDPLPAWDQPTEAMRQQWVDRQARLTTILMIGRLVTDRGDHVCRVRNVSPGGMMIECDIALATGERVRIELRNMNVVEAEIVWSRPPRIGVRFDAAHDVADLLHAPAEMTNRQPRAPRLSATCAVLLWHLGRTTAPALCDLSQSGCRLAMASPPPIGTDVRITVPGLPARHATLRWTRDGEAGFAFREMLSFADLTAWQRDYSSRFPDDSWRG